MSSVHPSSARPEATKPFDRHLGGLLDLQALRHEDATTTPSVIRRVGSFQAPH